MTREGLVTTVMFTFFAELKSKGAIASSVCARLVMVGRSVFSPASKALAIFADTVTFGTARFTAGVAGCARNFSGNARAGCVARWRSMSHEGLAAGLTMVIMPLAPWVWA